MARLQSNGVETVAVKIDPAPGAVLLYHLQHLFGCPVVMASPLLFHITS